MPLALSGRHDDLNGDGMHDPLSTFATVYAVIGVIVAVPFLGFGIDRIDAGASGAYVVRALLFPGVVVLWPVVAIRWAVLGRRRG